MLVKMFATLWNKLYRTAWVQSINLKFPSGYRYEDASFLYKLVPYVKTWTYVPEAFVVYMQREGSITHNHNERVKDMIYVFEDLLNYYQTRKIYDSYQPELEYLFTRFFLGNSFLRSCQIQDKSDRNTTLKLSYELLSKHFPNYAGNAYLKAKGLKNRYYRSVNRWTYPKYAFVFTWLYRIKKDVLH